jgi:hypothetical protein
MQHPIILILASLVAVMGAPAPIPLATCAAGLIGIDATGNGICSGHTSPFPVKVVPTFVSKEEIACPAGSYMTSVSTKAPKKATCVTGGVKQARTNFNMATKGKDGKFQCPMSKVNGIWGVMKLAAVYYNKAGAIDAVLCIDKPQAKLPTVVVPKPVVQPPVPVAVL